MHETVLGAGVSVRIDATAPASWHSISLRYLDAESRPLLQGLIGVPATGHVEALLRDWTTPGRAWLKLDLPASGDSGAGPPAGPASAQPWLRVAAVDALNRWLHAPMRQHLVDAERAATRFEAASSLPEGPARDDVLTAALRKARRAAPGLAAYLRALRARRLPVPETLRKSLTGLVEAYQAMLGELGRRDPQTRDQALQSVVLTGRRILDRLDTAASDLPADAVLRHWQPGRRPVDAGEVAGMVDPRTVRARVLQLSPEQDQHEIILRVADNPEPLAEVLVPAFAAHPEELVDDPRAGNLLTRLVVAATGELVDESFLTLQLRPHEGGMRPVFVAELPMPSHALETLAVEVFDDRYTPDPCLSGADPAGIRQSARDLSRWRQLVAADRAGLRVTDALVRDVTGDPAAGVAELAERATPPASAGVAARRAMASTPAEPLVAEVAEAFAAGVEQT